MTPSTPVGWSINGRPVTREAHDFAARRIRVDAALREAIFHAAIDLDDGATQRVVDAAMVDFLRPRVTVRDDDWIRSHEEAEQLLRYACLGATVIVEPIARDHQPSMRRWTVVLDSAETLATSGAEIYALPCLGAPLARRARTLCNDAQEALRRHRRKA